MTEKGEGKAADSPLFFAALRKATKTENQIGMSVVTPSISHMYLKKGRFRNP